MTPTLLVGDIVQVCQYSRTEPRIGDVIYYTAPPTSTPTIHRIVARDNVGLVTKGDNNRRCDHYRIKRDDIHGQVVAIYRGNSIIRIPGGATGTWLLNLKVARDKLARALKAPFRPFYRLLKASGLGLYCLPDNISPKLVSFRRGEEQSLFLMHRNRKLGYRDPYDKRWIIKGWQKLTMDEARPTEPSNLNQRQHRAEL